jgi:hypothetical protein
MRVAFETDGDYIMQGWILGHFLEEHASWKVLEESPEQITIGLRDPKRSEDEAVTYVFVEPDVIRQDTKIGPMYMRRVHD